jgi:hypothetical protein
MWADDLGHDLEVVVSPIHTELIDDEESSRPSNGDSLTETSGPWTW